MLCYKYSLDYEGIGLKELEEDLDFLFFTQYNSPKYLSRIINEQYKIRKKQITIIKMLLN